MSEKVMTPEEMAAEVKRLASQLNTMGRNDLLLKAVGASLLDELKLEAAKTRLSRLFITEDYRFILADYQNWEVEPSTCTQGCLSVVPCPSGRNRV